MATLLSAVTSNSDGTSTGTSHSGPCTVTVPNDSVYDGAEVQLQFAAAATAGEFVPIHKFREGDPHQAIDVPARGTYYLRGHVVNARDRTSVSLKTTQ